MDYNTWRELTNHSGAAGERHATLIGCQECAHSSPLHTVMKPNSIYIYIYGDD